ncbi:MAG TPA: heme ABC transporter permease CcmC [Candidatus Binatia bacterium]|nr:heme ABC transporter permease CcmC [Candidatus Binatia bacterium]
MFPDWLQRLASPPAFHRFAERARPWLAGAAALLLAAGFYGGLAIAPPDYQQGEGFRILYVHVPAAWLSLFGYTVMAIAAVVALVWRVKLAECVLLACAPVGASFTALALVTGMLWGKPMWGTYWTWDARLTSELVLLFLYLGVVALQQALAEPRAAARACALLALVGSVNVPIVHYSVQWWNTLHQGPSVFRAGGPAIDASMLWPLLCAALGATVFSMAVVIQRAQNLLLLRERGNPWVREALGLGGSA